ncbi:Beta-1,3-glucan-binding protein 1 [Zootermopsis nevadensis]|uniref:Beta-1,3-glucan-binding protein 1 n=1 Tax=Zootermopsis nevadensis TaxID=136037 RepID=A0A067RDQ0_ZOONE|nr:Beta-1,3-glucan-binding protein 1 [Zootermopsis nevadensis]
MKTMTVMSCSIYKYKLSYIFSFVKDGVLYIRPTLTADEYGEDVLYNGAIREPGCNREPCVSYADEDIVLPVQSARIRTINSFSFLYGRVEVRAKLPRGDWLWPAIWLKPRKDEYGSWPASGEIDIMEARANKKLTNAAGVSQGIDRVGATLHFGLNSSYNVWRPTHWEMNIAESGRDFADDFHVFGLEWTADHLNFTVDGKRIGSRGVPPGGFWKLGGFDKIPSARNIWKDGKPMAPFDKKFFIILNVAVGGNFFPDGWYNSPHPKPWTSSSPYPMRDFWEHRDWWLPTWDEEDRSLRVDYVRVYCYECK